MRSLSRRMVSRKPPHGVLAVLTFVLAVLAIVALVHPWYYGSVATTPPAGVSTFFEFDLSYRSLEVAQSGGIRQFRTYNDFVIPDTENIMSVVGAFTSLALVAAILLCATTSLAMIRDCRLLMADFELVRNIYKMQLLFAFVYSLSALISVLVLIALSATMNNDDIIRQLTNGAETCATTPFDCSSFAAINEGTNNSGVSQRTTQRPTDSWIVMAVAFLISVAVLVIVAIHRAKLNLPEPIEFEHNEHEMDLEGNKNPIFRPSISRGNSTHSYQPVQSPPADTPTAAADPTTPSNVEMQTQKTDE